MWRAASLSGTRAKERSGLGLGVTGKAGQNGFLGEVEAEADGGERVGGSCSWRREQAQALQRKPLRDVCREAGGWESRRGERERGGDCGKEAEPWGEG